MVLNRKDMVNGIKQIAEKAKELYAKPFKRRHLSIGEDGEIKNVWL